MVLSEMRETVTKFAEVISKVLDVDVMIVDINLKTVGNTFRYFNKFSFVRRISLVGQVITTGEVLAIDNRSDNATCKLCPDYQECEMSGFISVPIVYNDVVVGAIALILAEARIEQIFHDIDNSTEFLERMSDLLSSKLQNNDEYNKLNVVKREREVIMDSIGYAMVSMDDIGYITYYNKWFAKHFKIEEDCVGRFIKDVVEHPYISEFLSNYIDFSGRLVHIEHSNSTFYGFLSCCNIKINENRTGMLFTFKSFSHVNAEFASIGYHDTLGTFIWAEKYGLSQKLSAKAKRIAITSEPVLIRGETGVGKSVLAESIHNFSNRAANSFMAVQCGQCSQDLLEAIIFGTKINSKNFYGLGKLQFAHEGTVFLNEIEYLPYYLQKKLAMFLKTKKVGQFGGNSISVDVRIIASCCVDLENLVHIGRFDEELYYRLSENSIKIPSLREKPSTLHEVIGNTLEFYKEKYQNTEITLNNNVMEALENYRWPGNFIELNDVISHLVHSYDKTLELENLLPLNLKPIENASLQEIERAKIYQLLQSGRSKEEISKSLGMGRATLYRKIKLYDL